MFCLCVTQTEGFGKSEPNKLRHEC